MTMMFRVITHYRTPPLWLHLCGYYYFQFECLHQEGAGNRKVGGSSCFVCVIIISVLGFSVYSLPFLHGSYTSTYRLIQGPWTRDDDLHHKFPHFITLQRSCSVIVKTDVGSDNGNN